MAITAKVIADSVSPNGVRLTTLQLRYPRWIHPEFLTHRSFSRNASSSRAIPVERLIADVESDPAMPVSWGRNCKGMQAREELSADEQEATRIGWLVARDSAVASARWLLESGTHKQIINRVIEPFAHINVLVTATEWANFFALRRHADAQPEMHALADAMWQAREASTPERLGLSEWHLPYVDKPVDGERLRDAGFHEWDVVRLSVARCARVSYLSREGTQPTIEQDMALYDRLLGASPIHASPAEHQAAPACWGDAPSGNLKGWIQYRKRLPDECAR